MKNKNGLFAAKIGKQIVFMLSIIQVIIANISKNSYNRPL